MTTDRTAEPTPDEWDFDCDSKKALRVPLSPHVYAGPWFGTEQNAALALHSSRAVASLAAHLNRPPVALAEVLAGGGLVELFDAADDAVGIHVDVKEEPRIRRCLNVTDRLLTDGQSERGGEES